MLHDLLGWCLHSPRRLILSAVSGIAIAGLGFMLAALGTSERGDRAGGLGVEHTARTATASPAVAGSSRQPRASEEAPASWEEARATARSFLAAYLPGPRGSAEPRIDPGVERWVTPALWRGLRWTDPEQLPKGRVSSIEEIATGAFACEALAHLDAGPALLLTLVAWDGGWRVVDVRPGDMP